ncbi:class I SAM-dependent methyltransferase [Roseibium aquae]|nr:class I SAM-dependent methyltransferase [Roseibium aquae]
MDWVDIGRAREAYRAGQNVMAVLKREANITANTSEIIEIAYDLQAGSYIDLLESDLPRFLDIGREVRTHLQAHITEDCVLLDVGSGELTMLSLVFREAGLTVSELLACDLSWSRIYKGRDYWNSTVPNRQPRLTPFVADMAHIPLASKSVDFVMTTHALEPNGSALPVLLRELFRVCRQKLILFEPSYELNTAEGRARMDRLGYIKRLEETAAALGGAVIDVQPLSAIASPLNPTVCYVIEPPADGLSAAATCHGRFCVPGTDFPLMEDAGFLRSPDCGLVFPVLKSIPVLKPHVAILATALEDDTGAMPG